MSGSVESSGPESSDRNTAVSPAILLGWIADAGGEPWFPAERCRRLNVRRDDLDPPLAVLRSAGLIRVIDWRKGLGQGYAITPAGANVVHDPAGLAELLATPPPGSAEHTPAVTPPPITTFDRGEDARRAVLAPDPPVLAPALLFANVVWFLFGLFLAVHGGRSGNFYLAYGDPGLAERLGAITGGHILDGGVWRLFTCCFVHFGILHLLLNMYALGSLGTLAENLWGHRRFLIIYALSGIAGSCLAMALQPQTLLAGASGAVWGLLGSIAGWLLMHRQHLPENMVRDNLRRLGVIFLLNALFSLAPGVSWEAHFGGGGAGFFLALGFAGLRGQKLKRWIALATVVVVLGICFGGLKLMSNRTENWQLVRAGHAAHLRQAYLAPLASDLTAISPNQFDQMYRDVLVSTFRQTRKAGRADEVKKLQTLADNLRQKAENLQADADMATAKTRLIAYATAVRGLTDRLLDLLDERTTIDIVKADHKTVLDEWARLNQIP